jgi:predicted AlkP superfamily pyrophosphatase or phosphodiesterase
VDHAGHSYGFDPNAAQYISAIEIVDGQIGPILNAIEQRPNYANEDWLILISSDHGGMSTSHGGTSIEHREVAFIASGNSVATQLIEKDSSLVINNVSNCLGDFAELQFDGNNDYAEIPANSLFDFGANQDFTVECRIRTSSCGDCR